jgi:hypothetical protein
MTFRLVILAMRLACFCLLIAVSGTASARPVADRLSSIRALSCAGEASDAKGFRELAGCEAKLLGLPPEIAVAVMEIESGFNASAKGAAGEVGLMQVMPTTAEMLGFHDGEARLADPAINIALGVRYLAKAHQLAGGDLCTTVMKYRAGHGETHFSARSIDYCLRARKILGRDGYEVTGEVPDVTLTRTGSTYETTSNVSAAPGVCVTRNFGVGPRVRERTKHSSVKVRRFTNASDANSESRDTTVRVTRGTVVISYPAGRAR